MTVVLCTFSGYDSWGEEPDSDSDEDYNGFPANPRGFPYPVVMYPMVMPQSQRRKTKDKGRCENSLYRAGSTADFYVI